MCAGFGTNPEPLSKEVSCEKCPRYEQLTPDKPKVTTRDIAKQDSPNHRDSHKEIAKQTHGKAKHTADGMATRTVSQLQSEPFLHFWRVNVPKLVLVLLSF